MLARLRLRRGMDFRHVYSSRQARHGRLMVVHWRDNALDHPRVGFSISTRVGDAVARNLVKRRLREISRAVLERSDRGVDLVVVVRPAAAAAGFAELDAEFGALAAAVLGL